MSIPKFNLPILANGSNTLGNKDLNEIALISFVSDICGPCKKELINIADISEKYKNHNFGSYIFVVNSGDTIIHLADSLGIKCPIVQSDTTFLKELHIESIPTRILFKNNVEIKRIEGTPSFLESEFRKNIGSLIELD